MLKAKVVNSILFALALTGAGAAHAQTYVAGTVGQARWNVDCAGTSSCKTTDTAYHAILGYNFDQNWGVEGGYYSLGTVRAGVGNLNAEMSAKGWDLAGVFRNPFSDKLNGFVKLGLATSKGEVKAATTGFSGETSKNSTSLLVGIGATYAFTPNLSGRFEIESRKVDVVGGSGNVTNFNVGLQAHF